MHDRMRIGELTERAEVTPRTVRYYQSIGLLPPGEREGHGQYYYTEQTLARLRKIDQLKKLGLSLDEIRDVIDLYFTDPSGIQPKQKVLAILRQHLTEADQKIGALQQFRADLQANIERFERWFEETEHCQAFFYPKHDVNVMFGTSTHSGGLRNMSETIGFIGLGHLGLPMATNLLHAGYAPRVYNRTASKAESLVAQGAQLAPRPVDAVTTGGIVASIVWDDAALESIVMSDGFLEHLGPGGIHLAMNTVLPETSRKLAAIHAQYGCAYVEAPIFGRPEAAVAHQLWIPVAGPQQAKERVRPLLTAMGAQGIFDFGEEVGAATLVKLVGNFLIASAGYSMREALSMARNNGVDPKAVVEMLTSTLLSAPVYQSYGKRIAENNAPFSQNAIPLKDVGLFKKTAQQVESATPIANLLHDLLRSDGRGTADHS